jgi:hypothetical protein
MQMIEQRIFPTLVGKFENVLFPDQCDELISYIDTAKLQHFDVLVGDATTSFSQENILNVLPEYLKFNIINKIELCIGQYITVYGCQSVDICNNWVSYQYPNSKLKKHTHPGSIISGVLYLRADEDSSPIYFYNPNPFASFTTINDVENPFTREHFKFKPNTGDLLIFPSWLAHGSDTEENMSKERIILSFNTREV